MIVYDLKKLSMIKLKSYSAPIKKLTPVCKKHVHVVTREQGRAPTTD